MSDLEFDILDELYFLITYDTLKERLTLDENDLKEGLAKLVNKEWVRCYHDVDKQVDPEAVNFDKEYQQYYYLATKKGLFAHNSVG